MIEGIASDGTKTIYLDFGQQRVCETSSYGKSWYNSAVVERNALPKDEIFNDSAHAAGVICVLCGGVRDAAAFPWLLLG